MKVSYRIKAIGAAGALAIVGAVGFLSLSGQYVAAPSASSASLTLSDISAPATPSSGLILYSSNATGRSEPVLLGVDGVESPLQRSFSHKQIQVWAGQAAATTISSFGNGPSPTFASGTGTSRTQTATSLLTSSSRTGVVSGSTANATASVSGSIKVWRGNASGLGGFRVVQRFAISDASIVSTANMFVGIVAAPSIMNSDVNPDTKTNMLGVGCNNGDTTLQLYASGSTAQTRTDLGANFPVDTTNVEIYELTLEALPDSTSVSYQVRRLTTGDVATGTITDSDKLPGSSIFMGPQFFRSNGGTASAVGLDVLKMYLESG